VFEFLKIDKAQRIVAGIVYAPGSPSKTDSQKDWTTAEEIEKGMYDFMLRYFEDSTIFKVNHQGTKYAFPILESFIPEEDTVKGDNKVVIKKESWWLMVKVNDPEIWRQIESGKLNSFSMGGKANAV